MKPLYASAIILLTILLLGSCTIEKRLHQPGWHVEWRKQLPAAALPDNAAEVSQSKDSAFSAPILTGARDETALPEHTLRPAAPLLVKKELPSYSTERAAANPAKTSFATTIENEPLDDTIKRKVIVIEERQLKRNGSFTADPDERDPLTIALWVLCVLSLLAIVICIVLLFFSTGELFIAGFLIAELPFLLIVRSTLALLIRRREYKHPGMYRYSKNVLLGVLLPELFMLLAVALLVLFVVLGLGF